MIPPKFNIEALPGWCERHGAEVYAIKLADVEGRGIGWLAQEDLTGAGLDDGRERPLLVIPDDMVVSYGMVVQYAPENAHFHQLLQAVQFKDERQLILLYMLMQLVLSSPAYLKAAGVSPVAWTEYMGLQPPDVPLPTMWTAAELSLLKSTSLESAVAAKSVLLTREFATIEASTRDVPFWREVVGKDITLRDWVWVDALFRSRSFHLPYSGVACIPCLDLANHSNTNTTAHFVQDPNTGTVTLLQRKGRSVRAGEEVTISYGKDKPAAEMLFNYGFIDGSSPVQRVVFPLDEMLNEAADDDPLMGSKLQVFNAAPMLELTIDEKGKAGWSAPFIHLFSVHEQDGLSFRVEERQGDQSRRMLWRGKDITGMVSMFGVFINAQDVRDVVQLRAVSSVAGVVERELERIREVPQVPENEVRQEVLQAALRLRSIETDILERCLLALGAERDRLLQDGSAVSDTNRAA